MYNFSRKKNRRGRKSKRSRRGRKRSRRGRKLSRSKRSRRGRERKLSRRKFGYMKDSLLNFMGNAYPAQMSLAQSTTGMSAPQMIAHMKGITPGTQSNFYRNIV